MTLYTDQTKALDDFNAFLLDPDNHVMVIEGYAGTGKTHLTKEILKSLTSQVKLASTVLGYGNTLEPVVTATTNKAAKVIADVAGHQPMTLHSLLNLAPRVDFKSGKTSLKPNKRYGPIHQQFIIIDEASFIDSELLEWIFKTCIDCKILFIGDPYQLAPVNCSKPPVFHSNFTTSKLTELVRNPGPIGSLAGQFRQVLDGEPWPIIVPDGDSIILADGSTFRDMIDAEFTMNFGDLGKVMGIQDDNASRVVAWSNERVQEYNSHIRRVLGFQGSIEIGERLVNNSYNSVVPLPVDYHLSVRSIGYLTKVHGVEGRQVLLTGHGNKRIFIPTCPKEHNNTLRYYAKQKNWNVYYNIKEAWGDFRPMYAQTVHKSQGSTYDTVFIDLNDIGRCNEPETVARLLYVAISRARTRVVLYGELPKKYRNPLDQVVG